MLTHWRRAPRNLGFIHDIIFGIPAEISPTARELTTRFLGARRQCVNMPARPQQDLIVTYCQGKC
jgi:hypothetical protein